MQALSRDGGGGQVNDLAAGVLPAVAGPVHGLGWSQLAQHLDGPSLRGAGVDGVSREGRDGVGDGLAGNRIVAQAQGDPVTIEVVLHRQDRREGRP